MNSNFLKKNKVSWEKNMFHWRVQNVKKQIVLCKECDVTNERFIKKLLLCRQRKNWKNRIFRKQQNLYFVTENWLCVLEWCSFINLLGTMWWRILLVQFFNKMRKYFWILQMPPSKQRIHKCMYLFQIWFSVPNFSNEIII